MQHDTISLFIVWLKTSNDSLVQTSIRSPTPPKYDKLKRPALLVSIWIKQKIAIKGEKRMQNTFSDENILHIKTHLLSYQRNFFLLYKQSARRNDWLEQIELESCAPHNYITNNFIQIYWDSRLNCIWLLVLFLSLDIYIS